MLYEVITPPSQAGPAPRRPLAPARRGLTPAAPAPPRITSYNVCYTKLLRPRRKPAPPPAGPSHQLAAG
ncbi:hypothetical protein [Streptomyces cyaneogriseus]|uniref:hypothetical protein n=1 Tax=Streptomyces cyaneogriseus TaxID=68192 RepID=UPI000B22F096|nr:hypothetical protein [Streptomyces cyaneogriseus]